MKLSSMRTTVVFVGLALFLGAIPGAQAGRSARVGGAASVSAAEAEGDGVIHYRLVLDASDIYKECRRRNGRRICQTFADFSARIPNQEDEGETPDQSECRFGRNVGLFERTRRGRDRVAGGSTGSDGTADFGAIQGVSRGDEYFAIVQQSTFSDRYGDLITCASDTSNTVTL